MHRPAFSQKLRSTFFCLKCELYSHLTLPAVGILSSGSSCCNLQGCWIDFYRLDLSGIVSINQKRSVPLPREKEEIFPSTSHSIHFHIPLSSPHQDSSLSQRKNATEGLVSVVRCMYLSVYSVNIAALDSTEKDQD